MIDTDKTNPPSRLSSLERIGIAISSFAIVGLLIFPFAVAPTFVSMFEDFGGELPALTLAVLSVWFAPTLALLPLACLVYALWFRRGAPARTRGPLIAIAFCLSLSGEALCFVALSLPLLNMIENVS